MRLFSASRVRYFQKMSQSLRQQRQGIYDALEDIGDRVARIANDLAVVKNRLKREDTDAVQTLRREGARDALSKRDRARVRTQSQPAQSQPQPAAARQNGVEPEHVVLSDAPPRQERPRFQLQQKQQPRSQQQPPQSQQQPASRMVDSDFERDEQLSDEPAPNRCVAVNAYNAKRCRFNRTGGANFCKKHDPERKRRKLEELPRNTSDRAHLGFIRMEKRPPAIQHEQHKTERGLELSDAEVTEGFDDTDLGSEEILAN